ncbi:UDP-N-acetylglucosamine 1-carboxyvinyltransferase [Candidatus Daviesbacteria bacterium]|nr:UDP-N-acetylglucosamine 1-carboxyvinyltransferase [Candidatus Daviesbacteria bacterium]
MAKYIIEGGNRLKGKVKISGNKNSILPCLAAVLLSSKPITLKNVPSILDVSIMLEILQHLGVSIQKKEDDLITLQVSKIATSSLPQDLVSKLRASILLVGPVLAREGKVDFYHPGGDVIGKRSIESHIEGFEKLGFEFSVSDRHYKGERKKECPQNCQIFLEEASVTATENIILACSLTPSKVTVKNAAKEPHIVDLCEMLKLMGVKIEGVGQSTLVIEGSKDLNGCEFSIGPDYIEVGTYAIAATLTQGEIELENASLINLEPIVLPLQKMGVNFQGKDKSIKVSSDKIESLPKLITNTWPGFPTDLMSAVIVLATSADGVSLLHDWMYESRMFFVDKLISMGAQITIADPHRVLVYGPTKLYGRELETPDIRAGMALVLAALRADGQSVINEAQLIERGYENVVENLVSLGAKIQRLD